MMEYNDDVCATQAGCTGLLKHQIFLTDDVPIKQKPDCLSPPTQNLLTDRSNLYVWNSKLRLLPYGLYQFRLIPFGLNNASAAFQRVTNIFLRELTGCICFVSLDNINNLRLLATIPHGCQSCHGQAQTGRPHCKCEEDTP